MPATLVLGLGDPTRGDDGFGPLALAELQRVLHDPSVLCVATPVVDMRVLPLLATVEHVLVLTTARLGAAPGTLHQLAWHGGTEVLGPRLPPIRPAGIELLRMLHFWADPVPDLLVLGVEPLRPAATDGMSPAVGRMIEPVVEIAVAQLHRWGHPILAPAMAT